MSLDRGVSPNPPARKALIEENGNWGLLEEAGIELVTQWRKNAINAEFDITRRPLPNNHVPQDQTAALLDLTHGPMVLVALQSTCFLWASSAGSTVVNRLKSAVLDVLKALWLRELQMSRYSDIDYYWVFRSILESILINHCSKFKTFWDALVQSEAPEIPSSSQNLFSGRAQTALEATASRMQQRTETIVTTIMKYVCEKDAGAIPIPTEEKKSAWFPTEEVYNATIQLSKVR